MAGGGAAAGLPELQFSGAVRLADVSDYISPAQACVVATGSAVPAGAPAGVVAAVAAGGGGVVPGARAGVGSKAPAATAAPTTTDAPPLPPPDPVRVSLYDCLACAGCVTSAEAVLLESQGEAELGAALAASADWRRRGGEAGRPLVVSLTSQAAASLAAAAGVPADLAARRLAAALKAAGAAAVLDAGEARAAALVVAAAEFCARYAASPRGRAALALAGAQGAGDAAAAAAAALGLEPIRTTSPLPVLAGACPGWVCYAEKSAPAALPHLAAARSPQALTGAALKRAVGAAAFGDGGGGGPTTLPALISIAPCADKKLEAVRDEFRVDPGGGGGGAAPPSPETDCVLTTLEASRWLEGVGGGLQDDGAALPPLDRLADLVGGRGGAGAAAAAEGPFMAAGGGGSGGWAAFVFRSAAASLFGVAFPPGDAGLPWVAGRNAHARDLVLRHDGTGSVLLRVGVATGFRNIQSLLRRSLSAPLPPSGLPAPGTAGPYDYVEVMACPGGCTNGGGQVRGADAAGAAAAAVGVSAWEERARAVGEGLLAAAVDGGGGGLPRPALWASYQARGGAAAGGGGGGGGSGGASLAW